MSSGKIPPWQRATSLPGAEEPKKEATTPPPESSVSDVENSKSEEVDVKEQAAKFLQDPSITDAPHEKKIAFLESKGVKREDIDTLLGSNDPKAIEKTVR